MTPLAKMIVGFGTWLDDIADFFERFANWVVNAGLQLLPDDPERAVGSVPVEGAHSGCTDNDSGQLEDGVFHGPYADSSS